MEEEFFSTIKLISGEEIVAKVSYVEEDNCLFLFKPMKVETVKQKKLGQTVDGFVLHEWIHSTYDDSFIIPMDKILTMTELDKRVERYYLTMIDDIPEDDDEEPGRVTPDKLSTRMGYLGSISETKKTLEKIYKIS
jgi:hypothetical protein|tara:strand:- start:431 stop:838 length:408 start_codon:yes stop_codon:yes gene_type:complete